MKKTLTTLALLGIFAGTAHSEAKKGTERPGHSIVSLTMGVATDKGDAAFQAHSYGENLGIYNDIKLDYDSSFEYGHHGAEVEAATRVSLLELHGAEGVTFATGLAGTVARNDYETLKFFGPFAKLEFSNSAYSLVTTASPQLDEVNSGAEHLILYLEARSELHLNSLCSVGGSIRYHQQATRSHASNNQVAYDVFVRLGSITLKGTGKQGNLFRDEDGRNSLGAEIGYEKRF